MWLGNEFWAGIIGALVGAVVGGVITWQLQTDAQRKCSINSSPPGWLLVCTSHARGG